jgi:hypothetical protein
MVCLLQGLLLADMPFLFYEAIPSTWLDASHAGRQTVVGKPEHLANNGRFSRTRVGFAERDAR